MKGGSHRCVVEKLVENGSLGGPHAIGGGIGVLEML